MKPSDEFDKGVKCCSFLVRFLSFEKVLIMYSLSYDSGLTMQSESCDPVNSIEKSNLFGKSSPHFFVKSQPFSYQLVLNPHTVKTKGKNKHEILSAIKVRAKPFNTLRNIGGILYLVFLSYSAIAIVLELIYL